MCGFRPSVSRTHWQARGHEAVGQKWGAPLLGAIRRSGWEKRRRSLPELETGTAFSTGRASSL